MHSFGISTSASLQHRVARSDCMNIDVIINNDGCHAGITSWTFVSQNHSTQCTVTCMVLVWGLLLFGNVYVLMLRQVCQCLPGIVNVSSIPSFKDWVFRNGNVAFDVISHLTPHPALRIPHMHAHICMCRALSQLWQCAVFRVLIRSTGPDRFSGCHSHIPWLVCHG